MNLSPRELTCVALTAQGLTAKGIARKLNISASAVNLYLSKARLKLGAANTCAVVAIAVREKIIA